MVRHKMNSVLALGTLREDRRATEQADLKTNAKEAGTCTGRNLKRMHRTLGSSLEGWAGSRHPVPAHTPECTSGSTRTGSWNQRIVPQPSTGRWARRVPRVAGPAPLEVSANSLATAGRSASEEPTRPKEPESGTAKRAMPNHPGGAGSQGNGVNC